MTESARASFRQGTVILVCVGSDGAWGEALRRSEAERRVVVAADPVAARAVARKLAQQPGCGVVHAAIGQNEGNGELVRWNWSRMNSLRETTPLAHQLLPGLRLRERLRVPMITPAQLVARIGPIARPCRLILDTAGEEMEVLCAWKAAGLLGEIDWIEMHVPQQPFFAGAASVADLEAWLAAKGFEVKSQHAAGTDWADLTARDPRSPSVMAIPGHQVAANGKQPANGKDAQATREKELIELRWTNARLADEVERLQFEKQLASRDLEAASEVRNRLDADLRDLQGRYSTMLDAKRELEALLRRIAPALNSAAEELARPGHNPPLMLEAVESPGPDGGKAPVRRARKQQGLQG